MAVIELDGLSKWYGEVIGLNNVTVSVGGGITGLVGPNGAGKSTLMKLATGQLHPSAGTIRVLGRRVWDNPSVLSQIGYCPEGDVFWPEMTGRRFVQFLARVSGLAYAAARSATREAIEQTGMTEHMDRPIRGYSKGMRQRIKIAQALAPRPRLLILDEPLAGTDPVARHELAELFRRLAADEVDVLISSHILHEVEALTQQILMIAHGRIVAEGELHTVRRHMQGRPHAIRIVADDPRRLAAELSQIGSVTGLRITEPDTLIIETTLPEQIYDYLGELILRDRMKVREIAAADAGLEAVYDYLTRGSALE